jgi:hypothetical protein
VASGGRAGERAGPGRDAVAGAAAIAIVLFGVSRSGVAGQGRTRPHTARNAEHSANVGSESTTAALEQACRANHPTACGDLFWRRYRANDLEAMQSQSGVLCQRGIAYHCFALGDVAQALGRHDEAAAYYERGCVRDPANCRRQRGNDPGPLP